jgi:serine/threonine protein kinase
MARAWEGERDAVAPGGGARWVQWRCTQAMNSSKAWCDVDGDAVAPAPAVVAPELRPGLVLGGKYLLLKHVGIGGMGQVWVARNASTGADVAVKVLLPERAASADAIARFRREAHATAQLAHRGIIRVFDLLELDPAQGSLIMVMELLRGHTLAHEIHTLGHLGVEQTMEIVLPLLSALEHAHGVGIVHRDLKPENIFLALEPDGQVLPKLLDFGISKCRNPLVDSITADGELVGTPCYMSPEQARGKANVDARSDIFSVGILLYEMLSGQNPFLPEGVEGLHAVVMAILDNAPAPIPHLSMPLWSVVARALAKNRDDRYQSVGELARALRAAVPGYELRNDSRPVASYPSMPPGVTHPTVGSTPTAVAPTLARQRSVRAMASVAAAGLAVAVAVMGGVAHRVHASERDARAETPVTSTHGKQLVLDRTALATTPAPAIASAVPSPPPSSVYTFAAAVPDETAAAATVARPPRHRVILVRDPGF